MYDFGIGKTEQNLLSFNFLTCQMRTLIFDTTERSISYKLSFILSYLEYLTCIISLSFWTFVFCSHLCTKNL